MVFDFKKLIFFSSTFFSFFCHQKPGKKPGSGLELELGSRLDPDPGSGLDLDPVSGLDPDPDPYQMNMDPKPCKAPHSISREYCFTSSNHQHTFLMIC